MGVKVATMRLRHYIAKVLITLQIIQIVVIDPYEQAPEYDLHEVIDPVYFSEPVDEEENITKISFQVCNSHLGARTQLDEGYIYL